MDFLIFLLCLAFVAAIVFHREILAWRRERRRQPVTNEANVAWRQEFEAKNPDGPPWTQEEIDAFKAWHASLALPAVELVPAPERPVAAAGTRVGGPVWLQDGEAWPADVDGVPLTFVAQVDFAELPPLPDFPAEGLLQFFVGSLDTCDAHLEDPERGARVLWRPGTLAGGSLHPQPRSTHGSPFERKDVRDAGLSFVGQPAVHRPPSSDWRIDQRLEGQLRRPGMEEIDAVLEESEDEDRPMRHHVGGHPVFTQYDFRAPGKWDVYDRTLLRLTSDRTLIWGDCGEAAFLIPRRDLLVRDFSSVIFYWDCT